MPLAGKPVGHLPEASHRAPNLDLGSCALAGVHIIVLHLTSSSHCPCSCRWLSDVGLPTTSYRVKSDQRAFVIPYRPPVAMEAGLELPYALDDLYSQTTAGPPLKPSGISIAHKLIGWEDPPALVSGKDIFSFSGLGLIRFPTYLQRISRCAVTDSDLTAWFLAHGADPNASSIMEETPLSTAVRDAPFPRRADAVCSQR